MSKENEELRNIMSRMEKKGTKEKPAVVSCKRCGKPGHFSYQCMNFLTPGLENKIRTS